MTPFLACLFSHNCSRRAHHGVKFLSTEQSLSVNRFQSRAPTLGSACRAEAEFSAGANSGISARQKCLSLNSNCLAVRGRLILVMPLLRLCQETGKERCLKNGYITFANSGAKSAVTNIPSTSNCNAGCSLAMN